MKRKDLEKASEEYSKKVQICPHFLTMDKYWCFGCMIDFTAEQINAALEHAAVEISDAPTVENAMGTIRSLKIKD